MATSTDFLEFLQDQLRGLGHITARRMFSGAGLYCDGVIFALILRDTLYFKVDDGNRQAYEAEGLAPFSYEARGRTVQIGAYWQVPECWGARAAHWRRGGGRPRRRRPSPGPNALGEAAGPRLNGSQSCRRLQWIEPAFRQPVSCTASRVVSNRQSKSDPEESFHSALDRLISRGDAPIGAISSWRPAPACDWTCVVDVAAPAACGAAAAEMYIDADLSETVPRSIEEAVALELQLSDDLAPAELERLRRRFAYRNHPDRVGPAHQARALLRMTVANVLIDQALATARTRAR